MTKVVFNFTDEAFDDIVRLQQVSEAECLGDVVMVALRLYSVMHLAMRAGYRVGLVQDGELVKIVDVP